jgi:hypothetical protein
VNKDILDNTVVALEALPVEFQSSRVTERVARRFQEQDHQLADAMARAGWHRVGSTWVSDKELEAVQRQQKQTQDKLDALSTEFEKSKQRLDEIDARLEVTEEQMHRMEAGSYVRDPGTGLLLRLPLPAVYGDLQRDDVRLRQQHDAEVARLDAMKRSADALQQQLPGQHPAAGAPDVLHMIGTEGTPLRLPPQAPQPPAMQPAATQPT